MRSLPIRASRELWAPGVVVVRRALLAHGVLIFADDRLVLVGAMVEHHILLPILRGIGVYRHLLDVGDIPARRFEGALDLALLRRLVEDNEIPCPLFACSRVRALHDGHADQGVLTLVHLLLGREPLVLRILHADMPLNENSLLAAVHSLVVGYQLLFPRVGWRHPAIAHGVDA